MRFEDCKITKEMIITAIKLAKENESRPNHSGCDECFIRWLSIDIQNKNRIIALGTCVRVKKMLNKQYRAKYQEEAVSCAGEPVSYLQLIRAMLHRTIRI